MSASRDLTDDTSAPRSLRRRTARRAKHASRRRTQIRGAQVVGLTAALAAAAGASAVSAHQGAVPTQASMTAPTITTARIDRTRDASRDATRPALGAEQAAKARDAKLAAQRTLLQRRAAALAAAKAKQLAAAKAAAAKAAAAKAAAAKAAAAKAAAARAAAAAAPKAVLPTTGYHITATFGQGGTRWARNHTGLDFAAPLGTPIRSVLPGEVIAVQWAGAYGRQVKVRHANGTVTSYSHMSKFSVSVGEHVDAGDQVGAIGMTGNTTGPHVHFEVLIGGETQVDPMPWLRNLGLNP